MVGIEDLHRLSMDVQGEVPREVVEQGLREHLKEEEWKKVVPSLVAVITDPTHRYYGRVAQISWPVHDTFVGTEPPYRARPMELAEKGERKFGFVLKVGLAIVPVPEEALHLIEKGKLDTYEIQVRDEDGVLGQLIEWVPDKTRKTYGKYRAKFGEQVLERPDHLMMQEPTWEFSLSERGLSQLSTS